MNNDLDIAGGVDLEGDGGTSVSNLTPSVFNRLRERREAIGSERTMELAIPGYNGELVATYKLLDWSHIRKILHRMEKSKGKAGQRDMRELYAQCDTIAQACEEIKYYDPVKEEYVDLMEDRPVRYDETIGIVLGLEIQNARHAVLQVFKNDMAITAHYATIMQWMQGESEEVDEEYLGE